MSFNFPPVTRALLIANVLMYLLQQIVGDWLIVHLALWPISVPIDKQQAAQVLGLGFEPWQLLTYAFLHGSLTHVFFNMWGLVMFGGEIERLLGAREFAIYYLVCVVGAAIAQLIVVDLFTGGFYPTLGASGGIFGVLLAFATFYPQARIALIFPPIPMPAWLFVLLYGALELYLGVTGTQQGVAHFAHLGGMAFGFVLLQYWRGKLPFKPRRILMR